MDRDVVMNGALIVAAVYGGSALLHVALPAREVQGYACDRQGKPLRYRLNGLLVLMVTLGVWFALGQLQLVPLDFIAQNLYGTVLAAFVLGLAGSFALYAHGSRVPAHERERYLRCATADRPEKPKATASDEEMYAKRGFLGHFFLGLEFNPRIGATFDIKMWLYLVGAVMLALNILSAAALQRSQDGALSNAMIVYVAMFSWFLCEYLYFEEIHLYTYDLFAERLGFKLVWGCLCFYANFYCIGVWPIVAHKNTSDFDMTPRGATLTMVFFWSGWVLTRGANLQKFNFKRDPAQKTCLFGLVPQRTVPGSRLLCSGFWGLARHVNYLGELVQSLALSVPGVVAGGSALPLLYFVYYIVLFVPRERDDELICAQKYGDKWAEYVKRVPYRIVPFLY